jgi:hypothetical protein
MKFWLIVLCISVISTIAGFALAWFVQRKKDDDFDD